MSTQETGARRRSKLAAALVALALTAAVLVLAAQANSISSTRIGSRVPRMPAQTAQPANPDLRTSGHITKGCWRRKYRCQQSGTTAAAVPAVAATVPPLPPGWNHRPPMPLEYIFGPVVKVPGRTVVVGGMPGWKITLIAAIAAVLAAMLAVLADRAWAERRHQMADQAWAITAAPPPRRLPTPAGPQAQPAGHGDHGCPVAGGARPSRYAPPQAPCSHEHVPKEGARY